MKIIVIFFQKKIGFSSLNSQKNKNRTALKILLFTYIQRELQYYSILASDITATKYRIYPRISREIWDNFSKFDLYAGHKKLSKSIFSYKIKEVFIKVISILIILIFDTFEQIFFQFDLYAGRLIREYIR